MRSFRMQNVFPVYFGVALVLTCATTASAIENICGGNSRTKIYYAVDLEPMEAGEAGSGGIFHNRVDGLDVGCFVHLGEPMNLIGPGKIKVEIDFDVTWAGVIDGDDPRKGPNRSIFSFLTSVGHQEHYSYYRVNNMEQTVLAAGEGLKQYVEGRSKDGLFSAFTVWSDGAGPVDVHICEVWPATEILVKAIHVTVEYPLPLAVPCS